MKFLLVLTVLLVAFWIWRNNRQSEQDDAAPKRKEPARPMPMIACDQCGTHLPQNEAVQGNRGRYCCQEHRRQHEAAVR